MGSQGEPDHGRASTPQLFSLLPSGPVGRAPKAPQLGPWKKVPGLGGVSGGQRGCGLGQERDPLASCWAQFGFGPSERGMRPTVSLGSVPTGPRPGRGRQSQVQLVSLDVLELLSELQEGGPRGGVQVPAVLHDLVDGRRAAIGGIHLVALLHPRDDVLQGLRGGGGGVSQCEA